MSKRKSRWWLWLLLAAAGGVGLAGGWILKPIPPPPLPLPPETVEVEVVKEIKVPVPGPERVKIVERVKWQTKEVEVEKEVVREVEKVVEKAVEVGSLLSHVNIKADKYEGLNEEGKLAFGWKGVASCDIRATATDPWTTIAVSPLDLAHSIAQTTQAPEEEDFGWEGMRVEGRAGIHSDSGMDLGLSVYPWAGKKFWRRVGFYVNGQTTRLEFYNPSQESYSKLNSRVSGGVAITFGKLK